MRAEKAELSNVATTAGVETLRNERKLRLVTKDEEGFNVYLLPNGVYGFTFAPGLQEVPLADQPRQVTYERELQSFVAVLRGEQAPDRSLDHEILVQETLLRTTRGIEGRDDNA